MIVERLRHSLLAPGFLRTGRGGSKPPGSPGWRPLPGSKAFGLQQPTGYHLFTIHSYLLPSPTQVGDAGRVRELTYWYKPRCITVCGTALPHLRFPPYIVTGRVREPTYSYKPRCITACGTATSRLRFPLCNDLNSSQNYPIHPGTGISSSS